MANLIKTKRGLDIQINGKAKEVIEKTIISEQIAIIPDYYHGITPKVVVKEGDIVKAGSPVFHDKKFETMNFVSPVSGKILSVNRGERRKVLSIVIENDKKNTYEKFDLKSPEKLTGDEIKTLLLSSGLWTFIKQRPYDVIANPTQAPKSIFISCFDSAPLAPNNDFVIGSQMTDFQTGINMLGKLTTGKVNLGTKAGDNLFSTVKNVEITQFDGPHPIGNVGIQINNTQPVNKGEVVWTINVQDVLFIGRFFSKGIVDLTRTLALTGPEVNAPQYCNTLPGCRISQLVEGKLSKKITRIICGNVLSGTKVEKDGYLDPYATQISVIREGEHIHELVGWAMPRFNKFSVSGTYFTGIFENKIVQKIFGKRNYKYDTRLLGGKRAIIMSGEYDKVLPMDILPEFLIKAMIAGNIDKMEALGAYEIAPEDVALCEFVCTSKLPLQQIVRTALDNMKQELD
ncbi:MAG TPA: Na(+)-translocating NADH-quinone reductase subunit A [Paludibacter sp.]|nr:Na(+)-translocating NADH-quinone reductase subunit A [Paludibacter sp.]